MNTQTDLNTQATPITPVTVPPAVPAAAPVVPATPSNNQPPATPPASISPVAPAPVVDPFANSNWPESAKNKVRELSRKNRDKTDTINQQQAYINKVDEQMNKLVHPSREQFPDGDSGDHQFVSAISSHNANKAALAIEKVRATGVVDTVKAEAQTNQAELANERIALARAEFKDLDQVIQSSTLPVGQHLGYALQVADNGPAMMYILNKLPPQETQRLNGMAWTEILQELPGLEARYRASSQKPVQAAIPPAAPIVPPIEPIGGDGGFPSTGNGYREWEAERNKNASLRF